MKSLFFLLSNILLVNSFVYSQAPTPLFQADAAAVPNCGNPQCSERHIDLSISDAPNDFFRIQNGTLANNQFIPWIRSHHESDARHALHITASTSPENDVVNNSPLMIFDSRVINYSNHDNEDIINQEMLVDRPLFGWNNLGESKMILSATGSLGIGITNPSEKLDVNGNIKANSFQVSSDKRYKKDIKTLKNSLEKITKLRGTEYDYRIDEFKDINFDDRHQIGFIAQEIREVLPELVHEDLNGYLSVNYQGLIPVLTEAIKEINAENTIIKAENKQLKTEFSSLQDRVQQLEKLLTVGEVSTPKTSTTNVLLEDKSELVSVYPNPFNNVFTISYQIKGESTVSIKIVDNQGKEVSLLANKDLKLKGTHQVNFNAEHLARGIYYYTIETDEYFKEGKIIKQ